MELSFKNIIEYDDWIGTLLKQHTFFIKVEGNNFISR